MLFYYLLLLSKVPVSNYMYNVGEEQAPVFEGDKAMRGWSLFAVFGTAEDSITSEVCMDEGVK